MKKVLFSLVALMFVGSMFAQTPEEKAAAKAAAAAEKQANKDAQKLLDSGLKFYDEAKAKFDEMGTYKQMEKDPVKLQAKTDLAMQYILEKCAQGNPIVGQALATGRISEKKLFDTWYKRDFMISQLINNELQKAQNDTPFDTTSFCNWAVEISDACHYQLKYGNAKDDTQKNIMVLVGQKFPRIHAYHAYATMFQIQCGNLEAACKAFEGYKNFAKNYPEVANNENVQNPSVPYSQLAFNIYYTAYNQKNYDLMSQYYDEALTYEDEQSQTFVKQSGVAVYLQKGDTLGWVNACKETIKADPDSETGETYTQNLLAYYSKKQDNASIRSFTDEILAVSPNSKIANYGKGYTYVVEQKFEEALPYYQKAVEIDPEYMEAQYQCGFCLYQTGLANYRTIQNKKYTSQAAADKDSETKVKAYFRKAMPYFEKVQELVPDDPTRWASELRVIYNNLGMKSKAEALPED